MGSTLKYNERAWAIDVIAEANKVLAGRAGAIRRAGGESSLSAAGEQVLFPDVLLYGAVAGQTALQGWELKFPDTPISDAELISNATSKADRLKTDSFVLWNVTTAQLWQRTPSGEFAITKEWRALASVTKRREVRDDPAQWGAVLTDILDEVELLVRGGSIQAPTLADVLGNADAGLVADIVAGATPSVAAELADAASRSATLRRRIAAWWDGAKFEYDKDDTAASYQALAGTVVATWLNRFLTAHVLRPTQAAMDPVIQLPRNTSVASAMTSFHALPASTDFAPVFGDQLGEEYVPAEAWQEILAFNQLLEGARVASAAGGVTSTGWFHHATELSRARSAGQYTTPRPLANLLVALTLDDFVDSVVADPCCGTGTIARAVYDAKATASGPSAAYATTWLSDKFAFPLQAAQLQMVDPALPGEMIRLFQEDVFLMKTGQTVSIADPVDGSHHDIDLPAFDTVITNAPFVRADTYRKANPNVSKALAHLDTLGLTLDGRSDLYAYVLVHVWTLMADGGRLGIVTSNSWLASEWGNAFRETMTRLFDVEMVVCSARGRWFTNAEVVTALLVGTKRNATDVSRRPTDPIRFVTLSKPLSELDDIDPNAVAAEAAGASTAGHYATSIAQGPDDLAALEAIGACWTAAFAQMDWVVDVTPRTIPLADVVAMGRGERRGWNAMFHPKEEDHSIEPDYLRPLLKSPEELSHLVGAPEKHQAFSCDVGLEELEALGHAGALAWIKRFEGGLNTTGQPLPVVLAKTKGRAKHWYGLDASELSDFVTALNPDRRLFFARLSPPSFVNQRLIRMTAKTGTDRDLVHALLNCTLSMFLLEASGFGRGAGVLDLAADHLKRRFRILDPAAYDPAQRSAIASAFEPLLLREVLSVEEELLAEDRAALDAAVLSPLGLDHHLPAIRAALSRLYEIRQAVLTP